MLSENFINHIIDNTDKTSLQVFAKVVMQHISKRNTWNDSYINNAIELISGIGKIYTEESIDNDKLFKEVKSTCYKGENAFDVKINYIDNIDLQVYVTYSYNTNDENRPVEESTCNLNIFDVLKDN